MVFADSEDWLGFKLIELELGTRLKTGVGALAVCFSMFLQNESFEEEAGANELVDIFIFVLKKRIFIIDDYFAFIYCLFVCFFFFWAEAFCSTIILFVTKCDLSPFRYGN